MPDKLTPAQRHKNMVAIHGKDTKPELMVRKYLWSKGFRYRLNYKRLPAHPDIALPRLHTVIMVNGCFWHGHEGCKYFVMPKTRSEFWEAKIQRNRERDLADREKLTAMGWNVITVWECQLKPAVREKTLQSLVLTLSKIELDLAGKKGKKQYADEESPIRMVADSD